MSQTTTRKRTVTTIPATIQMHTNSPLLAPTLRKTVGYARVSTGDEEQATSYAAQLEYYERFITQHENWVFCGIYADEGISGTSTKRREHFNQMIADALAGKFSLIVTKSISRFARNTVDTLNAIRLLKANGVEVYFEKDGIYTFDAKGELLITVLASLAQEESRSISENVTWGWRRRFEDGKVSMAYKQFLGYKKGEDGKPEIVPEEAALVQRIYNHFLDGMTGSGIAKHLMEEGVPTASGRGKWLASTVESILTNEKYKGDALLQKKFTVDFLTKRTKVNEGEVPQHYVTGSHPAIIDPEVFDFAQVEMKRRKALGRAYSDNCFSSRVVCGDCGSLYGPKVWYSNTRHRRIIWRCNSKYEKGGTPCATPHFTEDEIKRAFLAAFNRHMKRKDEIISVCREAMDTVLCTDKFDRALPGLQERLEGIAAMMRSHIDKNARVAQDQAEYEASYGELAERFQEVHAQIDKTKAARAALIERRTTIMAYLDAIQQTGDLVDEFTGRLWNATVDVATFTTDGALVIRFKDGSEVEWG